MSFAIDTLTDVVLQPLQYFSHECEVGLIAKVRAVGKITPKPAIDWRSSALVKPVPQKQFARQQNVLFATLTYVFMAELSSENRFYALIQWQNGGR